MISKNLQTVVSKTSKGATTYSGLKFGTPGVTKGLDEIKLAKAEAIRQGIDYNVPNVITAHGESD
jgi:hypothetical protein